MTRGQRDILTSNVQIRCSQFSYESLFQVTHHYVASAGLVPHALTASVPGEAAEASPTTRLQAAVAFRAARAPISPLHPSRAWLKSQERLRRDIYPELKKQEFQA